MNNQKRINTIKQRLTEALQPEKISVIDESAQHVGHPGAQGGGHFALEITSKAFLNKSLVERHRMIYAALGDLMKTEIHALKIQAND